MKATGTCQFTYNYGDMWEQYYTSVENKKEVQFWIATTLTDYQCVSTGCCTHVAKTEITIDNQHVTKSLQRYRFISKQPKENTEKITNLPHFLNLDYLIQVCLSYISVNVVTFFIQPAWIVQEPFSEFSLLPS